MRGKVLDSKWKLTEEDPATPSWKDVENKDWEDLRMATYSAQIEQMDRGIGKIIEKLKSIGELENTIIMFAADNGGCAEFLAEDSNTPNPNQFNNPGPDGKKVNFGNITNYNPESRVDGTTVVVTDLFGNMPARRKFLKSSRSESKKNYDLIKSILYVTQI